MIAIDSQKVLMKKWSDVAVWCSGNNILYNTIFLHKIHYIDTLLFNKLLYNRINIAWKWYKPKNIKTVINTHNTYMLCTYVCFSSLTVKQKVNNYNLFFRISVTGQLNIKITCICHKRQLIYRISSSRIILQSFGSKPRSLTTRLHCGRQ